MQSLEPCISEHTPLMGASLTLSVGSNMKRHDINIHHTKVVTAVYLRSSQWIYRRVCLKCQLGGSMEQLPTVSMAYDQLHIYHDTRIYARQMAPTVSLMNSERTLVVVYFSNDQYASDVLVGLDLRTGVNFSSDVWVPWFDICVSYVFEVLHHHLKVCIAMAWTYGIEIG